MGMSSTPLKSSISFPQGLGLRGTSKRNFGVLSLGAQGGGGGRSDNGNCGFADQRLQCLTRSGGFR